MVPTIDDVLAGVPSIAFVALAEWLGFVAMTAEATDTTMKAEFGTLIKGKGHHRIPLTRLRMKNGRGIWEGGEQLRQINRVLVAEGRRLVARLFTSVRCPRAGGREEDAKHRRVVFVAASARHLRYPRIIETCVLQRL